MQGTGGSCISWMQEGKVQYNVRQCRRDKGIEFWGQQYQGVELRDARDIREVNFADARNRLELNFGDASKCQ